MPLTANPTNNKYGNTVNTGKKNTLSTDVNSYKIVTRHSNWDWAFENVDSFWSLPWFWNRIRKIQRHFIGEKNWSFQRFFFFIHNLNYRIGYNIQFEERFPFNRHSDECHLDEFKEKKADLNIIIFWKIAQLLVLFAIEEKPKKKTGIGFQRV